MKKNDSSEKLLNIHELLGITDGSESNVVSLIKDQNPASFKENLIQVFSTLSYPDAQKVYKLFESHPEVKSAWLRALELKIEKNEAELKIAEYNKSLVDSLDHELTDLLKKHTICDEENQEMKEIMNLILNKEIEQESTSADPSEIEIELITNNQEIMHLIKTYFKRTKGGLF